MGFGHLIFHGQSTFMAPCCCPGIRLDKDLVYVSNAENAKENGKEFRSDDEAK